MSTTIDTNALARTAFRTALQLLRRELEEYEDANHPTHMALTAGIMALRTQQTDLEELETDALLAKVRTLTAERDENKRLYRESLRNVQVGVAHAADLAKQLEQAEKERDRWEDAEVKAKCDWADDHEALTEQLQCANQNMKAMNANGDKLREALRYVAFYGSSVPLGMPAEDYYHGAMNDLISHAARALPSTPGCPKCGSDSVYAVDATTSDPMRMVCKACLYRWWRGYSAPFIGIPYRR